MGGGAMRTVAKVAALGGTRMSPFLPGTTAAAVTAASVHVAPDGEPQPPSVSITASEKEMLYPAGTQWPALDVDDNWELAGGEEEVEVLFGSDVSDPPPRLVFGSAPTLEEAKEATSDLKEALEKTYFSPHMNEAVNAHHVSETAESGTVHPVVPKHVTHVFSLLQAPEAQCVVASLASDKNVWDAIVKNEKVVDFFKNHQSVLPTEKDPHLETYDNKSVGSMESPLKVTSESSSFTDWVENIKVKVSEVVNNLSYFLQDFMGTSTENKAQTSTSTSTAEDYVDVALGASFMSLAVATILIVLVRRG